MITIWVTRGGLGLLCIKHSVLIDLKDFYMPNVKHFKYHIYSKGKRVHEKSKMYKKLHELMIEYDSFINDSILHKNNTIQMRILIK